ncbi:tyrosine-type recombinase/integrase [Anaerosinus massiliensis]|uniref:tyrosine-type recombinase/integrase n=1 Tax=Massilibacillus massiliensis TaxID=1806837 RepID=UPI000B1B52E6|nr:tyrosine-type recombinase/integrase [Massilibacillus massiliensis]
MKLPNGYGSVHKLSGKRRKPWAVRITVGYSDEGKQLYKYLDYYEKRELAIHALAEYNANPYDLSKRKLTYADVFREYCEYRYTSKGVDIPNQYTAAFNRSTNLHDMIFIDIRMGNIQESIDNCEKGYASKKNIRILANLLFKYALANDLVDKNYAELTKLPFEEISDKHKPFTDEELNILWKNTEDQAVRFALIFCYSGLRPTELLKIKTKNVFLKERYMLGGIKTAAGINRVIPIAEKIYDFIAFWYNPNNEFLITDEAGEHINNYDKLRYRYWNRSTILRNMDHLPHDGRHTCATNLDNANISKVIIQRILGHASKTVTDKVYTHKTIQQLIEAINLI